jgi:hypothetical protein
MLWFAKIPSGAKRLDLLIPSGMRPGSNIHPDNQGGDTTERDPMVLVSTSKSLYQGIVIP